MLLVWWSRLVWFILWYAPKWKFLGTNWMPIANHLVTDLFIGFTHIHLCLGQSWVKRQCGWIMQDRGELGKATAIVQKIKEAKETEAAAPITLPCPETKFWGNLFRLFNNKIIVLNCIIMVSCFYFLSSSHWPSNVTDVFCWLKKWQTLKTKNNPLNEEQI